ncbi:MAG: hypothetical protein HZC12_05020 [Nitrospirae bacterium]|nr:hypothetical protein [Nitrospirota bacterium]
MEIPEWLRTVTSDKLQVTSKEKSALFKRPKERFLDKTLRHIVSFTEDIMFNERVSFRKGFLQRVEPRLKIVSLLLFIVMLSFQRSIEGIALFLAISLFMAFTSRVPVFLLLKRLFPAVLFTAFIAMPAMLNIIVKGESLLTLYTFEKTYSLGPITIPAELSITRQGLLSALTLFLRVVASVSIVFLLTLTTPPNRLMKSVSSFMPGALKSIVSISYRYIFFLVKKVEQFIMGFRSRNISSLVTRHSSLIGQRWVASRMGILFSLSLRLSQDLEKAMESRGYKFGVKSSEFGVSTHDSRLTTHDILWLIFSVIFMGAMLWKSLM